MQSLKAIIPILALFTILTSANSVGNSSSSVVNGPAGQLDITTTCLAGGWHCSPKRPGGCCSCQCDFSFWSGYVCSYGKKCEPEDAADTTVEVPNISPTESSEVPNGMAPADEIADAGLMGSDLLPSGGIPPIELGIRERSNSGHAIPIPLEAPVEENNGLDGVPIVLLSTCVKAGMSCKLLQKRDCCSCQCNCTFMGCTCGTGNQC